MDRATLTHELAALGIDEESWRLVALLPLVQVAWADGEIQPMERKIIVGVARKRGMAEEQGIQVLEGWLSFRPSTETFARAQRLLRELAGNRMSNEELGQIVTFCDSVTQAASGLLGEDPVTDAERDAVEEIVTMLGVQESPEWGQVRAQLGL